MLLAHPWIAEARVTRSFPSEIHIFIKEHIPLAILDLGRNFILNSRGKLFKEWMPSDPDNLPIITGLDFSDIPLEAGRDDDTDIWDDNTGSDRTAAFDAVMKVLQLGQEPDNIIPNSLIEKIEVDREMGITLKLVQYSSLVPKPEIGNEGNVSYILSVSGIKSIKLGYNNYPLKYERLKKILFYLKNHPDVRFAKEETSRNFLPIPQSGAETKGSGESSPSDKYNSTFPFMSEKNKGNSPFINKRQGDNIDLIDLNNLNRIVVNSDQLSVFENDYLLNTGN